MILEDKHKWLEINGFYPKFECIIYSTSEIIEKYGLIFLNVQWNTLTGCKWHFALIKPFCLYITRALNWSIIHYDFKIFKIKRNIFQLCILIIFRFAITTSQCVFQLIFFKLTDSVCNGINWNNFLTDFSIRRILKIYST